MAEKQEQYPLHPETVQLADIMKQPFDPKTATVSQFRKDAARGNEALNSSVKSEFCGSEFMLYIPSGEYSGKNPPVLVVYHGGGMVLGELSFTNLYCSIIAHQAECIVINVDYRLYPENAFDAPYEDAVTVAKWALANKQLIGAGKNSKVGVEGDSVGGKLAASVAHDVEGLAFQILVYPHTSTTTHKFDSYERFKNAPYMNLEALEWFHRHMRDAEKKGGYHPRADSLGRPAESFEKLPPALIISAEIDPLVDQASEYAAKLKQNKVVTEYVVIKGTCHGFYTIPGIFKECCKEAYEATEKWIRKFGTVSE